MTKHKILYVDDEASHRKSMHKLLVHLGYNVVVYENPQDALLHLKTENFPLIITDLEMPTMDGTEFCQKVRRINPRSIIYALSGRYSKYDYHELEGYGFNGHLSKPVNPGDLQTAIEGAFETFMQGSENASRD